MQAKSDGSFGRGQLNRRSRSYGFLILAIAFLGALPSSVSAGGSCTTNANCNLATNFCRPGTCDLFGQCHYNHSDAGCRGQRVCAGGASRGQICTSNANCPGSTCLPPSGDELFCNGDNFCNEATQACAVNPVSCQPPTPQCSEALDACVECTSNAHCTTTPELICNTSSGSCVQCTSNQNCNDGLFCNGQETCNGGVCQNGTPPTCTTKVCDGGTNIGLNCTSNANCPGGGVCTPEYCSETYQGCTQCVQSEECDDGLFCNGEETCAKQLAHCEGGTNNNQPCTTNANCPGGVCIPLRGRCAAGSAPVCKRCSGGAFEVCETNGDCQSGTCTASGFCDEQENDCAQCLVDSHCPPDLNFCTEPACVFNTCVQVADPAQFCGDGLYCNGDEVCLNNQVGSVCTNCMIAHPATCSGGSRNGLSCGFPVNCPGGSCVPHESDCKGKVCNSFSTTPPYKICTTNADCPAGVQCVDACCGAGTAVNCADGIDCTLNKCNEALDSCVTTRPSKTCNDPARSPCETNADCPAHSPSYTCTGLAYCDDGLFCNGERTCGADGCEEITPRVCTNMEAEIACDSDADCFFCNNGPNEGDPCELPADCPSGTCVGSTCEINCRQFDSQCSLGDCNETSNQCVSTPIRINQPCDDGTACTINEICNSSGSCIPNPNLPPTDSYRCVKLEWRNVSSTSIFVGDAVTADLYAVADACAGNAGSCPSGQVDIVGLRALISWDEVQLSLDPPASSNPQDVCNHNDSTCYECKVCTGGSNPGGQCISRCSAGPGYGFICDTNTDCNRVCSGGTSHGSPCTVAANCPGGSCVNFAATCSSAVNTCRLGPNDGLPCTVPADCPSSAGQPPATCSNQLTCLGGGVCGPPPVDRYNWFLSSFLNDCPSEGSAGDGVNGPCPFSGFPGNDGEALYTAFDQFVPCSPGNAAIPACVPPSGLLVSRFRFRAISGGQSALNFLPCLGTNSKTSVTSSVQPPSQLGLTSADVLKSLTPSAAITVKCTSNAQCNDQNPCTTDSCNLGTNTCVFTNNNGAACNDGLFCTPTDICTQNVCSGGANNNLPCTTNANCPGGTCVLLPASVCRGSGTRCPGSGTCQGGTNPGTACSTHATCISGWCSASTICDEANDRCAQCLTSTNCVDNNLCTQDVCNATGMCQNPPFNCNDGLSCTTDVCFIAPNPPHAECRHDANHAVCENNPPLFCSARLCDPLADPGSNPTGCAFGNRCVSTNGNPCDNPGTCNEQADNCGGCLAPAVIGSGSRYLTVTPSATQGSTPVAILIEGHCDESSVNCVSKYLVPRCVGGTNNGLSCTSDANCPKLCSAGPNNGNSCSTDANCPGGSCRGACDKGFLGLTPAYLPGSSWGTVHVHGADIRPNSNYHVYSLCNFASPSTVSAATQARTPIWGNANGVGLLVDFADIAAIVNAFRNIYTASETYQSTNIMGVGANACGDVTLDCFGQGCINFGDVAGAVDAFRGVAFPCPAICPVE